MKELMRTLVVLLFVVPGAMTAHAAAKAPGAFVLDVRTVAEWQAGHLEGALLIPYDRIGGEIEKAVPDRKSVINLYCRTGRRTALAEESLKKMGYTNIVNLGSIENAAAMLKRRVVK